MNERPAFVRGDTIDGRYLVLEHRRGGLSEVYLTFDLHPMERHGRALKTLRAADRWNAASRAVLHGEAAAWVSLGSHPNIVRCFLAVDIGMLPYLILDWVADEESRTRSVRDVLKAGLMPRDAALDIASDVYAALLHCSATLPSFAHGDIKPENVLIGEDATAKLTDFGLARTAFSLRAAGSAAGPGVRGTPHYMAPELWRGSEPDERADVYAFGCLLYEMIEGHPPFQGSTLSALRLSHLGGEPEATALMPSAVVDVVRACLEKDPERRPAGYAALAHAVASLLPRRRRADTASGVRQASATDWGNRAITLTNAGAYDEAFEAFDQALRLDPELSRAYNNRAILYQRLERYDEALRDWERALEIDPDFVEVLQNRAVLYLIMGRPEPALRDATKAVALNDRWPTALVTLSQALKELARGDEALALADRALALDPNYGRALQVRGELRAGRGDFAGASEDFAALMVSPDVAPELAVAIALRRIHYILHAGQTDAAYAELDDFIGRSRDAAIFAHDFLEAENSPLLAAHAQRRMLSIDDGRF